MINNLDSMMAQARADAGIEEEQGVLGKAWDFLTTASEEDKDFTMQKELYKTQQQPLAESMVIKTPMTFDEKYADVPGTRLPEGAEKTEEEVSMSMATPFIDAAAAAAKMGGGATRMVGKGLDYLFPEESGGPGAIQSAGTSVAASGKAWEEAIDEAGGMSTVPAWQLAGMVAAPMGKGFMGGAAIEGGLGASYTAGEGASGGEAMLKSIPDAIIGGGLGYLSRILGDASGLTHITGDDIRSKGLDAFISDTRGFRKQLERLSDTTAQPIEKILADAADYIDTVKGSSVRAEDAVRMAVESTDAPRAADYILDVNRVDPVAGANKMLEAQTRVDSMREQIKNPALLEIIDRNTHQVGNIRTADWASIHNELKGAGIPEGGPLMKQIEGYSKLDDVGMVNTLQGKMQMSGFQPKGTRASPSQQVIVEVLGRLENWIASNLPGEIGRDARLARSVRKSLRGNRIEPGKLVDSLLTEGFDPNTAQQVARTIGNNEASFEKEFADIDLEGVMKQSSFFDETPTPASGNVQMVDIPTTRDISDTSNISTDIGTLSAEEALNKIGMRSGFVNPDLAVRAGSTAAGSGVGAALDEDNRLRGALVGGAVGAAAPSVMTGKMRPGQLGGSFTDSRIIDEMYELAYREYRDFADPNQLRTILESAKKQGIDNEIELNMILENRLGVTPRATHPEAAKIQAEIPSDAGLLVNEQALRSLDRLQRDLDKNDAALMSMYDEGSQLYKPVGAPGTISHPDLMRPDLDFREDPLVKQRIVEYTEDIDDTVHRSTRGAEPDLLDPLFEYPPNYEGTMYRGSRLKGPAQKAAFDELQKGDILGTRSHLSTSTDPDVAREFMQEPRSTKRLINMGREGDEKMRHPLHVTIQGKGHFIEDITSVEGEMEALIQAGNLYEVLDKREIALVNHLLIRQLPAEAADYMRQKGVPINRDILQILGLVGTGSAMSQINEEI